MRNSLMGLCVFALGATSSANEGVYEGTWITTNRKLDGTMTAIVTETSHNQWHGHFFGVWEGVAFSYKVDFSGPPTQLRGTAVVDGANYEWTGSISSQSPAWFKGTFGGDRYFGNFNLKRK